MSDRDRLDRILSLSLTAAAVAMAAAVVSREFKAEAADRDTAVSTQRVDFREHWTEILRHSRPAGDTVAPVRLVEFVDLECAACREFHRSTLPPLRERFGRDLALAYVHLPLRAHRFAKLAAKGAECAALQNRFGEYVDATFRFQDSLGLRPWAWYAREAGVTDIAHFESCFAKPALPMLIDSGSAIARRLGIRATPTLLVNGWRVTDRSDEEMTRVITALLGNRRPY